MVLYFLLYLLYRGVTMTSFDHPARLLRVNNAEVYASRCRVANVENANSYAALMTTTDPLPLPPRLVKRQRYSRPGQAFHGREGPQTRRLRVGNLWASRRRRYQV